MNLALIGLKKRSLTALQKNGWVTVGDVVNAALRCGDEPDGPVSVHFSHCFPFDAGILRYRGVGRAVLEDFENCIGLHSTWRFEAHLRAKGYTVIPPYRGA